MGTGGGDRLILGEDADEDEMQLATGRHSVELGDLGAMSPPDVDDDDEDDAEELLKRLQEQNERSWSRCPHSIHTPCARACVSALVAAPVAAAAVAVDGVVSAPCAENGVRRAGG